MPSSTSAGAGESDHASERSGLGGVWFGTAVVGLALGAVLVQVGGPSVAAGSGDGRPSAEEVDDAAQEMLVRASVESMAGSAGATLETIQVELEAVTGPVAWAEVTTVPGSAGCSTAEVAVGGAVSEDASSSVELALGDEEAARAMEVVASVAVRRGYTGTGPSSGGTSVRLTNDRSGHVEATTDGGLHVRVVSDCYLPLERADEISAERSAR